MISEDTDVRRYASLGAELRSEADPIKRKKLMAQSALLREEIANNVFTPDELLDWLEQKLVGVLKPIGTKSYGIRWFCESLGEERVSIGRDLREAVRKAKREDIQTPSR